MRNRLLFDWTVHDQRRMLRFRIDSLRSDLLPFGAMHRQWSLLHWQ